MQRHDIVIIGAGLAGGATAHHLAARGRTDVVVLEREATPGRHSSGRNVGFLRQHLESPAQQALADESGPPLRDGRLGRFRPVGSFLLGGPGDDAVSAHVPLAEGRGCYFPDDGRLDGMDVLLGYLQGLDVRHGVTVERFARDGDGLRVRTDCGELWARTLVNAAGPWAGELGGLPLRPFRRHVYVTQESPGTDPGWPWVWDLRHDYYFAPEAGGLLVSACDELAAAPGDYTEVPVQLERLGERFGRWQPRLPALQIARRWVGQRTFAPDREFVIGFDPREPHLFWVAGLGGHGLSTSWAVGRLAADRLLAGPGTGGGDPFDPARLVSG